MIFLYVAHLFHSFEIPSISSFPRFHFFKVRVPLLLHFAFKSVSFSLFSFLMEDLGGGYEEQPYDVQAVGADGFEPNVAEFGVSNDFNDPPPIEGTLFAP